MSTGIFFHLDQRGSCSCLHTANPSITGIMRSSIIRSGLSFLMALEAIKKESPDLMILDLMMPVMDGFAVCKQLQDPRWSKWKNMPVLILTSVREEVSQRRYELETCLLY